MLNRSHISILLLLSLGLAACGPDLLGAAATGAAAKKQELQQLQGAQQKATEQLQHATEQMKQRNDQADEAAR